MLLRPRDAAFAALLLVVAAAPAPAQILIALTRSGARAGGGYNTNRLKLDVALQYRWSGFQASEVLSVGSIVAGGLNRDAIGRVASREWRFKFSLIYRILDTKKVKDLVGRVFG